MGLIEYKIYATLARLCLSAYHYINRFIIFLTIIRDMNHRIFYFVVIILDIDECEDLQPCHQLCLNTNGSYMCGCRSGYELTNSKDCIDIDECQEARCSRCSNWPGSFKCFCDDGYRLNLTTLSVCDSGYLKGFIYDVIVSYE